MLNQLRNNALKHLRSSIIGLRVSVSYTLTAFRGTVFWLNDTLMRHFCFFSSLNKRFCCHTLGFIFSPCFLSSPRGRLILIWKTFLNFPSFFQWRTWEILTPLNPNSFRFNGRSCSLSLLFHILLWAARCKQVVPLRLWLEVSSATSPHSLGTFTFLIHVGNGVAKRSTIT